MATYLKEIQVMSELSRINNFSWNLCMKRWLAFTHFISLILSL